MSAQSLRATARLLPLLLLLLLTTAPAAMAVALTASLTATQTTTQAPGSVSLTATVAGGVGPYTVQFKQGSTIVGTVSSPATTIAYTVTNLAAGPYTFTAAVTDSATPTANTVTTADATVTVNAVLAATVGVSPTVTDAAGSPATGSTTVTASVTGGAVPYTIQFYQDGSPVGTAGAATTYSATSLAAGTHAFHAVVTDSATPTANTVTTTNASVTVNAPLAATVSVSPTVTDAAGSPATGSTTVTASVTGGTAPFSIQFFQDGTAVGAAGTATTYAATGLAAGTHAFHAVVTDSAGGTATSADATVTVKAPLAATVSVSPTVTDAAGSPATGSTTVTASVTGGAVPYTIQFYQDGSPVGTAGAATTYSATGLAVGFHTFGALITDSAGGTVTTSTVPFTVSAVFAATVSVSPTVTDAAGSPATGSTTVTASVTGGTAPFSIQFYQDGTAVGTAGTATTYAATGLAVGSHAFHAVVTDSATPTANTVTTADATVTVKAPLAATVSASPTTTTAPGSTTVTASVTGGTAPFSIQFYQDGNPVGMAGAATTYAATGLTVGSHTFTAVVTDSAGGSVATANTVTVTVTVSTALAATVGVSPAVTDAAGSPATGGTTVTASVTGGAVPYTIQFYQDGSPVGTAGAATTYSATSLAAGTHAFHAVVTDSATPTANTVTTTNASVTVNAPLAATVSVSPTVTDAAGSPATGGTTVTASVTGGAVPYTIQFYQDGSPVGTAGAATTYSATGLAVGFHTFGALITDSAGGTVTTSTVPFTVSAVFAATVGVSPTVTDAAGSPATGSTTVTASVTGGTAPFSIQFFQDGSPVGTAGAATTYAATGLAVGSHAFHAVVTDSAGGTVTTADATVTVNPIFTASVSAPLTQSVAPGSATVTATMTGGTVPYSVQFYQDGNPVGSPVTTTGTATTAAYSATGLAAGAHAFHAVVTDSAGGTVTTADATVTVAATTIFARVAASPTITDAPGSATVTASVSGGLAPYSIQFFQDGTAVGLPGSSATYAATGLAAGSHTFHAVVADSATPTANTVTTADATVTVNPILTASVTARLTNANAPGSATVTASVSGGLAPYSVQFFQDGTAVGTPGTATTYPATGLTAGAHTFRAVVTDSVGGTATAADVSLSVSAGLSAGLTASPTVTDAAGSPATGSTTVTASVTGGTAPYSIQFFQDGNAVGTPGAATTYSATSLTVGAHKFTAVVTDSAGGSSTATGVTTAPVTVTVNGTLSAAVSATLTQPNAPGSATVTAVVTGGTAPYSIQFFQDGNAVGTAGAATTYPATGLTTGTHTFSITVTDNVGVTTPAASSPVTVTPAPMITGILPSSVAADDPGTIIFNATAVNGSVVNGLNAPLILGDPSPLFNFTTGGSLANFTTDGHIINLIISGSNFVANSAATANNYTQVTFGLPDTPATTTAPATPNPLFSLTNLPPTNNPDPNNPNPNNAFISVPATAVDPATGATTLTRGTAISVTLPADQTKQVQGSKAYDAIRNVGQYKVTVRTVLDGIVQPSAVQTFTVTPAAVFHNPLQLISVPYDYPKNAANGPLAYDALGDLTDILQDTDVSGAEYGLTGSVMQWTGAAYQSAAAGSLRLGKGYWVLSQAPAVQPVSLLQRGYTAAQTGMIDTVDTGRFPVSLQQGWNMIGDPSTGSVLFGNIRVRLGSGATTAQPEDTLAAAFLAGIVSPAIYDYNSSGAAYSLQTTQMDPYVGYWVYAYQPCTLLVPVPAQ